MSEGYSEGELRTQLMWALAAILGVMGIVGQAFDEPLFSDEPAIATFYKGAVVFFFIGLANQVWERIRHT